jgi:hypothetical protein
MLAVAARLLDDGGADREEPSGSLLLCAAALRTDAERNLVAGAASVTWPAEHVPGHHA